ncbi:uncharacterized protein CPUR_08326 [Claviceps purpurea 20.1]|uniref:Uncharacterized protein n=1 Tax=Claviceps purpurea (strain 20.1) TaxID=1111077 RepID=M1WIF6_CLAP2|nr:uncharacterized protein CPUR_08326 [Claviceps purpurea 20.1]
MDCRSSSAVQDGGQPTLLTSRVDALEDDVQDLNRQMDSVNDKLDKFETMMAAINNQLKAMKESNDKLTSQMTKLESSMDSRFTEMESGLDTRFTKMNNQMTKMDLSMNSRFQDMNSRVDDLRSDMNSRFEEMTQKCDKTSIKMEALNKNTMSRFDNRLPGAPPDALEPLFNVNTGEEIQSIHSRADFARMTYVAMAECLHELGLTAPKHKDERLRKVKKAYGADIHIDATVGVRWNRDTDADERAEDDCT